MRFVPLGLAACAFLGASAFAQPRIPVDQSRNWNAFQKLYPKRALNAGEQGLVAFRLTLDRNGHPTECYVTHSSGHPLLDNETCDLLMMHVEYQVPRDANGDRMRVFRTEGVINWSIGHENTKLIAPVKVAKVDPLEKKICRRYQRTGTLAGFERRCATVREWDKTRQEITDDFEEQRKRGYTTGAVCMPDVAGANKC